MAKVCCEAMGIKLSLLQGLDLVKTLDDMLNKDMCDAEMLVVPTNISSEAEFHSSVPELLNKLADLFGLIHSAILSQNRTRGGETLHAVVSPAEFRWAGGRDKISVGAISLHRGANGCKPLKRFTLVYTGLHLVNLFVIF